MITLVNFPVKSSKNSLCDTKNGKADFEPKHVLSGICLIRLSIIITYIFFREKSFYVIAKCNRIISNYVISIFYVKIVRDNNDKYLTAHLFGK